MAVSATRKHATHANYANEILEILGEPSNPESLLLVEFILLCSGSSSSSVQVDPLLSVVAVLVVLPVLSLLTDGVLEWCRLLLILALLTLERSLGVAVSNADGVV